MRDLVRLAILGSGGLAIVACGGEDPCAGVDGACIGLSSGASYEEVQTALIEIPEGGTVAFGRGTFSFEQDLSLDVDDVIVLGQGADRTILSFANQTIGAQGMLVTSDRFEIHDLALEDSPGDALKLLGSHGVSIHDTRVEWTHGSDSANGAYGLYPVQCTDVVLENNLVIGASDAGVYVGQSDRIVVRNNRAEYNVAGIEIENSMHADVHGNVATHNTGGILVFNLPDLEVENGAGTRVFDNDVFDNNTVNFAPEGNIVGKVPTGTGIALLAAHQVEVFGNRISDHDSINIGVFSYVPTDIPVTDPRYDQYPTAIDIHDNTLTGTSDKPTGELGALLISAIGEIMPDGPFIVPDIAWDGMVDPARTPSDDDRICIHDNGDADFINLAWPLNDATKPSTAMEPHACSHPALPAVEL